MKKIWIKVKPNKKQLRVNSNRVVGPNGEIGLEVWLTKLPINGQANDQLLAILAKHFNISKNKIMIIKGTTSHLKLISLGQA